MPVIRNGSFLPLTILSIVLDFPLAPYHEPKSHRLFRLYRCLINVFFCPVIIFNILVALSLIDFSYMGVMIPIEILLSIFMLLYYRIKYIYYGDGNIIGSIDCLDKKLETLNVSIPHGRNKIISFAYIAVNFLVFGVRFYQNFDHFMLLNVKKMNGVIDLAGNICFCVFAAAINIYGIAFNIRLVTLLYFLRQRLGLIEKYLLNYNRRNIAWSDHGFVPVLRTLNWNRRFREDVYYIETILSLYCCSYNIFENIRKFYSCFFKLHILTLSIWYPVLFIINIIENGDVVYKIVTVLCVLLEQMYVLVCTSIANELRRIHSMTHRLYYKLRSDHLQEKVKNCLNEREYIDIKFDCEFFEIDIAIFTVMIDYILLFSFAMLPNVYR